MKYIFGVKFLLLKREEESNGRVTTHPKALHATQKEFLMLAMLFRYGVFYGRG